MIETRMPLYVLLLLPTFAACAVETETPDDPASAEQAIVGGATDTTDSAVVFLYASYPSGYATGCTGTVIAPRVVLTAAHCLMRNKDNPDPNEDPSTMNVGFGSDFRNAPPVGGVANGGKSFVANPAYDPSTPSHGHDTGIVFLSADAPIAALGYSASIPSSTWIGQTARLIGYGDTSLDAGDSKLRREIDLPLAGWNSYDLAFNGPKGACHGDSGGPVMMAGTSTIIGVISIPVGGTCTDGTYASRVDTDVTFINAQVGSVAGPGSPGGTPTPPKTSGCSLGGKPDPAACALAWLVCLAFLVTRRRFQ